MSIVSTEHIVLPEDQNLPEGQEESTAPEATFAALGLPEAVVRKLAQNGVTVPFPIQAATIPDALAGKDILGRGRTGSGKTLSFGLPTLATLAGGHTEKRKPRAVILTPTRELAMQVADALQPYGDVLGLKMKVVCGGTSMGNQIYALERGVDILVATPGRLRDIINRGACSLEAAQIAVLDEADQMSDLGFLPEVTELLDQVPAGGQRMLFSATMENEIATLVKRYLNDPVHHEVDAAQGAVTTMSHHILIVKPKDKAPVTAAIASRKGRTIIFVRTQLGADRVAEQLRDAGVQADALHGGMTQGARTRTLADFKDGYVSVLVATDVAARGIHVDGIDLVLNVDPAGDHKDYLHRAGRTARAGRTGTVVSLSLPHQRRQLFRLMEDAGVDAGRHIIQGGAAFDPEVAEITGARSMTEVQAESAGNAAQQAEREVDHFAKQLERATRRAAELRGEADRLVARAARERGEDPAQAVAQARGEAVAGGGPAAQAAEGAEGAAVADAHAPVAGEAPEHREVSVPAQPAAQDVERIEEGGREERTEGAAASSGAAPSAAPSQERPAYERPSQERPSYERRERRDDRGERGERGEFNRDRDRDRGGDRNRSGDRDRGFDRGGRSFERRDDRGGFRRDGDRGGFRRDERGDRGAQGDRGGFNRDGRDRDRGGRSFERRDERGGFNRDSRDGRDSRDSRDRGGDRDRGFRRDDRRDDRGGRGFERRDGERGGFRRDGERGFEQRGGEQRGFERGSRSSERRDERGGHRGSDRPFNRDRQGDRPSGGYRSASHDRPYSRRDDHRGSGSTGSTGRRDDHRGSGSTGRREDKPRWKRNG